VGFLKVVSHTFIIRIWEEKREIEGALPELRGVIEFVPNGKRFYFSRLDQMAALIRKHLLASGLQLHED
jgi:hypothetical protein